MPLTEPQLLPAELADAGCSNVNLDQFHGGTCAQTVYWGDGFSRHLYEGSVLEDKLGVGPTPGVQKVLDHKTGKLVDCTESTCPYGTKYPDIGIVNHAPFAAAGGWSAGVAAGLSPERESAMAQFISFVCGKQESFEDVITDARRSALSTGADPFRKSHFNLEDWVAKGYPRDTTEDYLSTITQQFNSPNIVLDARFPTSVPLVAALGRVVYSHLLESKTKTMTHGTRMEAASKVGIEWNTIITEFDKKQAKIGALPLKDQYMKSLNIFIPPAQSPRAISTGMIIGLVVGCSFLAAAVVGSVIWVVSQRKIADQKRIAEEIAALGHHEDDSNSDRSVSLVNERDETAEVKKLTWKENRRANVWRLLFVVVLVTALFMGPALLYLALQKEYLSAEGYTAVLTTMLVLIGANFFFYDQSVRRRTDLIIANAARANAVVTNMFPGQFRDEVLREQEEEKENQQDAHNTSGKMKRFLTNDENGHNFLSKPLADLYLETTIIFADIVGFTPWSSARSPEMVFMLLENVYSAFDAIASRRGIYKVETGECSFQSRIFDSLRVRVVGIDCSWRLLWYVSQLI